MGNKIVLCVDDEETILNSLDMDLFDAAGEYQVELATNGMEAVELVGELIEEGNELAVVISDHIMPEMKGDELLIKIHEDHPATVKILLTGQSQIDGVTNAINQAALYRYIAKPWQKDDLKLTLKTALQKYEADQLLLEKEEIIQDMNKKLFGGLGKDEDEAYRPEGTLSDEELYDQIYYSRFFQSLGGNEKKWFALASIGLINSDKKLTRSEMNYLNSIVRSDREKESVEYYIQIIKQKTQPNLESLKVSNELKYRLVTYLSQILISAKTVGKNEEEHFNYICSQLGIDQKATNECLKIVKHKIMGNYLGFKLKEYIGNPNPIFASSQSVKMK